MVSENGVIKEFYTKSMEEMLKHNLIPVPYGDLSLDLEKGCATISTEKILSFLAKKLKPDRIILAGSTNGVFTSDPHLNKDAEFIPEITSSNFNEIKKHLKGSHATDVTGGMLHKIKILVELAKFGVESQIISGLKEGNLKDALLGNRKIGTTVKA
jgi:isopentenyl phosphate kinase